MAEKRIDGAAKMKVEYWLMRFIASGYYLALIPNYFYNGYECDLFTLNTKLYTAEYEIKRSKADYEKDFEKIRKWSFTGRTKHEAIKQGLRTNRFYFVLQKGLNVEIPDYAGLITFEEINGRAYFERKKDAPLLHKKESSNGTVKKCLQNLSWRYQRELFTNNIKNGG